MMTAVTIMVVATTAITAAAAAVMIRMMAGTVVPIETDTHPQRTPFIIVSSRLAQTPRCAMLNSSPT
jgi:hypothetical protein